MIQIPADFATGKNVKPDLIQGISLRPFPGLVNFVPAVAYQFCLNLPAAFLQLGNGLIDIPCSQKVFCTLDGAPYVIARHYENTSSSLLQSPNPRSSKRRRTLESVETANSL